MALLDHLVTLAIVAGFVGGSVVLLVRRSLVAKDSPELRRPPSQTDLLPASWRRWVLDGDERRNSN